VGGGWRLSGGLGRGWEDGGAGDVGCGIIKVEDHQVVVVLVGVDGEDGLLGPLRLRGQREGVLCV